MSYIKSGAQEKTRTSTILRSLAPEASASTNSATWAYLSGAKIISFCMVVAFRVFSVNILGANIFLGPCYNCYLMRVWVVSKDLGLY